MFKAITGGDTISAEYKFHDAFEFTPFSRLMFSANAPPKGADLSEAFFDRWLVVPFSARFRQTEQEVPRAVLDARLADPRELSGVLNHMLNALRNLRNRGHFEESASMVAAAEDMRREVDPLKFWLNENTFEHPDVIVVKRSLIAAYNASAVDDGQPFMTDKAFTPALRRLRPNVKSAQRTVDGYVRHVWVGIDFKPVAPAT